MKRVLLARPDGSRLYELTDEEFARVEHLLSLSNPRARAAWVARFLSERIPKAIYRPGRKGPPEDLVIDRAIGGNQALPKWGTHPPDPPSQK